MPALPYLPSNKEILYVLPDNIFMQEAKRVAENFSLDPDHPTGAVVVKNNELIGFGANGSNIHKKHGCERKRLSIPTGQGYELCEGCHPKNHAEQKAIRETLNEANNPEGADLYLWGHWWCCESCWEVMIESGIKNVYLPEGADGVFKK